MDTKTLEQAIKIAGILDRDEVDQPSSQSNGAIRIVVLQRGWVAVGRYYEQGSDVVLKNAKIIRRWGTSKGLGQLVAGPLDETTLDPAGTLRQHRLAVVTTFDCKEEAWSQHL